MLMASCTGPDRVPIVLGNDLEDGGSPPVFVEAPDSAADAENDELIAYCPSNQCPPGFTTCPDSRFPCDVNLKADLRNCGACGSACPLNSDHEVFACAEGRCEMTCRKDIPGLDCDGVPDNGCETDPLSNENCGACGAKCPDPAKPCVDRAYSDFGCGCLDGKLYCPETADPPCTNASRDDNNCAKCGNACDPAGGEGAAPPPDNMYYGCLGNKCGQLKCAPGFGDCDANPNNGCEESLISNDHCGGCGNICGPGKQCALDMFGTPFCACPTGETFCSLFCMGETCFGACRDLTSDAFNCGGCGLACPSGGAGSSASCTYGSCSTTCESGRADCNGNTQDGCEVNTMSDPFNCGACNVACDAIAGQACVGGRCVVEPCDQIQDDGGLAR